MSAARPIRLRHAALPLIAMLAERGLDLSIGIKAGYDPATVNGWRVEIYSRYGSDRQTWVGGSATVTVSGQTLTLAAEPDVASDDDEELLLSDVIGHRGMCFLTLMALPASGPPLWQCQGPVDFVTAGTDISASTPIGRAILLDLGAGTTIEIAILGNSEAGAPAVVDNAAVVAAIEEDPEAAREALELGTAALADEGDFAAAAALADYALSADLGTAAFSAASAFATAEEGIAAIAAKIKTDFLTVTANTDLDSIRTKVTGLDSAVVLIGEWDASAGTFPGSGTAQRGNCWIVSTGGTVGGVVFNVGDRITAIVDNASTSTYAANWFHEDYTDRVSSVADLVGAITASALRTALGLATTSSPSFAGLTLSSQLQGPGAYAGSGPNRADFNERAVMVLTGYVPKVGFSSLRADTNYVAAALIASDTKVCFLDAAGLTSGSVNVALERLADGLIGVTSGNFTTSGQFRDMKLRDLILLPSASKTPANNGELVVEATSNTSVTIKLKGSDGTVRSVALTLS